MKHSPRKLDDKKIFVGYRLRPSTISLVDLASKAWDISRNQVIEDGAIERSKKLIREKACNSD